MGVVMPSKKPAKILRAKHSHTAHHPDETQIETETYTDHIITSPGSQFAPFIAPDFRRMFLFAAGVVSGFVILGVALLWIVHAATAFVDTRSRASWAEVALQAQQEHKIYDSVLKDHNTRIEKLEQQGQETRMTLTEIKSTANTIAQAVKDVHSDLLNGRTHR